MLKPRENIVMVERIQSKDKTDGGLLLPEVARQKTNKGKVIAIGRYFDELAGKEKVSIPLKDLKIDNIVLFPTYAGNEIQENGKDYLFLRYDEVLAIEQ